LHVFQIQSTGRRLGRCLDYAIEIVAAKLSQRVRRVSGALGYVWAHLGLMGGLMAECGAGRFTGTALRALAGGVFLARGVPSICVAFFAVFFLCCVLLLGLRVHFFVPALAGRSHVAVYGIAPFKFGGASFVLLTRTKAGCSVLKRCCYACTFITRNGVGPCLPVPGRSHRGIYPHGRNRFRSGGTPNARRPQSACLEYCRWSIRLSIR